MFISGFGVMHVLMNFIMTSPAQENLSRERDPLSVKVC